MWNFGEGRSTHEQQHRRCYTEPRCVNAKPQVNKTLSDTNFRVYGMDFSLIPLSSASRGQIGCVPSLGCSMLTATDIRSEGRGHRDS